MEMNGLFRSSGQASAVGSPRPSAAWRFSLARHQDRFAAKWRSIYGRRTRRSDDDDDPPPCPAAAALPVPMTLTAACAEQLARAAWSWWCHHSTAHL